MIENNNNRDPEAVSGASKSSSVLRDNKPICYKCKHRGGIPGDAHSRCLNPRAGIADKDPFESRLFIASVVGNVTNGTPDNELNVTGNDHGIASGWFNWPMNFDPVWLETCDGFKEK